MSKEIGRYNTELHLFQEEVKEPNLEHLMFLRWMVDERRIEHGAFGEPSGEIVAMLEQVSPSSYTERLRDNIIETGDY